ncbi:MAG: PorV/PorQ family protein [Ignavibacteria bacterium]|jgi:hypothetical protein
MVRLKLANKFIVLIIFMLACQNIFSQNVSKVGTTAASFLEIGAGASAIGMGGAFVGVANDASALYWNAGGIAEFTQYEAILVHTEWLAETSYDFAALVIPLGNFGNLGFSLTSLTMDDMKVTTVEKPDGTGEYFSASDIQVGVSYARSLTDRFSIGFTAKYIEQKIYHMKANAFAIDVGTKFRTDLLGGMIIGASISNFGTEMQLEGRDARYYIRVNDTKQGSNDNVATSIEMDSWDLPLLFRIGVSTFVLSNDMYKFRVAADASVPNNDYKSMNVGGELCFLDFLFFRGGYNSLFLEDGEGGLSLGFGVNSKMVFSDAKVNFDYAYRDFGRLEGVHNFSVGIKF